jgi:hypothetical protein
MTCAATITPAAVLVARILNFGCGLTRGCQAVASSPSLGSPRHPCRLDLDRGAVTKLTLVKHGGWCADLTLTEPTQLSLDLHRVQRVSEVVKYLVSDFRSSDEHEIAV